MSVGRNVAIALSGGVDSAVAAALLQRQGLDLQGVHLRLSPLTAPPDRVKALAHSLGIPLTVLDLQAEFTREVVDYFVSEYVRGRTPNPCVRCNAAIKFGNLWEYLKKGGVTHNDFPGGLKTQLIHQRHGPGQNLRHPPADGGGVNMDKPTALQVFGQAVKLAHHFLSHDGSVIIQGDHRVLPSAGGLTPRGSPAILSGCRNRYQRRGWP